MPTTLSVTLASPELERAIRALDIIVARRRSRTIRIAVIDGQKALGSPMSPVLQAAGYTVEPNGLVRELRTPVRER